MGIVISLLVVVHVIVCLLLVVIVLMQRPKQEGLGAAFGGGMTDQMFGAQTTDVLQKGTVWLSVMFFVITMVLAILIANRHERDLKLGEVLSEGAAPGTVEEKTSELPVLPKPPQSLGAAKAAGEEGSEAAKAGEEGGNAAVKTESAEQEKPVTDVEGVKGEEKVGGEAKPAGEKAAGGSGGN